MRQQPNWRVLNRGVNGERSDQIRARFTRDVVRENPDLAVVIAGVNDIYQGVTPDALQQQLEAIGELARTARPDGIPLVVGSILPYNTATELQNERMRAVNEWLRRYASRNPRVTFCDTRAAVASAANPNCLAATADGIHPVAEGYRQMALALEPAIISGLGLTKR
jgi:lysophospholipase L1-like esterase